MRNAGSRRDDERVGSRPQYPGVIDTLGFGYTAVMTRPFTILPLLLLELGLLFVPRLTLEPISRPIAEAARRRGSGWSDIAAEIERLNSVNVLEVSALGVPLLRTPALVPGVSGEQLQRLPWSVVESDMPWWLLMVIVIGLLAAGLIVAASYRLLIAAASAGVGSVRDSIRPAVVGRMMLWLIGWTAVVLGMLALIAMPMMVVTFVSALLGYPESAIVWMFIAIPIVWGYLHFYFSIPALFIDRGGPLPALRGSYRVVRDHFWPALGLIALSFVITTGLSYAFRSLASNAAGVLAAVVLNAVVVTGIAAASMLFYRDRVSGPELVRTVSGSGSSSGR